MTKQEKEMGLYINENGNICVDYEIFANYFVSKGNVLFFEDERFMQYKKGIYIPLLRTRLRIFVGRLLLSKMGEDFSIIYVDRCLYYIEMFAFSTKKFNKHKNLICLNNGVLNLETKELLPHSPDYYFTRKLPIDYDETADFPQFKKFLNDIFLGNKKIIKFVQEMMGYILTNSTKAQCFFVFYGIGSNGKSVLAEILSAMVGEANYTAMSIDDMKSNFSRAELDGVMLNISTENESPDSKPFDTQHIKAIASGDDIKAEKKYQDPFKFKPTCKLIFCTNALPRFNDKSKGFLRRLKIIPFDANFSIKDGTADINLAEKLKGEMSGIFNFALRGLDRLVKNDFKFTESKKMKKLMKEYEELTNPFDAFWDECITTEDNLVNCFPNTKNDFYSTFIKWCEDNKHKNYANITHRAFWHYFGEVVVRKTNKKLETKKSGGDRYVKNLFIKDEYCRRKPRKKIREKMVLDDSYDESDYRPEDDEL